MVKDQISCLIIDDDDFIRELLSDKLQQYFPQVKVLATASSGISGMEQIAKHKPDLIFLDVEMKDMTGFEMLSKIEKPGFYTIFITSYSHYAIKAIRFNALDYLLKPVDLGELKQAINRFQERVKSEGKNINNTEHAVRNFNSKSISDQRLLLKTQDGEMKLPLKDIIYIEGERNYSFIHLVGGTKKLCSKTLSDLEDLLDDKNFFRCHKSHIINAVHISRVLNNGSIQLSSNITLQVSRRKKEDFKHWYSLIS